MWLLLIPRFCNILPSLVDMTSSLCEISVNPFLVTLCSPCYHKKIFHRSCSNAWVKKHRATDSNFATKELPQQTHTKMLFPQLQLLFPMLAFEGQITKFWLRQMQSGCPKAKLLQRWGVNLDFKLPLFRWNAQYWEWDLIQQSHFLACSHSHVPSTQCYTPWTWLTFQLMIELISNSGSLKWKMEWNFL